MSQKVLPLVLLLALGCTPNSSDSGGSTTPTTYQFVNSLSPGVPTNVSTNGQSSRKINIEEVKFFIRALTADIDNNVIDPTASSGTLVLDELLTYYEDTNGNRTRALALTTTPATQQSNLQDISASGKSLRGKTAGNDTATDYRVWGTPGNFTGWSDTSIVVNAVGSIDTPEGLIRAFLGRLNQACVDRKNGTVPLDPDGSPIASVFVTADGRDLDQLVNKLLRMAINYAQAMDDYLDTDITQPSKGLLADNTALSGTNPFTTLEHQWDEGWGYFGAARDYGTYTDDEIASKGGRADFQGSHDTDGNGMIDLDKEINLHVAVNAAKRDRGSDPADPTNFTASIFNAFVSGRQIITAAAGRALSVDEFSQLEAQRDIIVANWEKVIAAQCVHYINLTIQHIDNPSDANYFTDIAKHWSELKGFALGLQFNPRKKISDANFATLHANIGDAPVLKNRAQLDIDNYKAALIQARDTIIGPTYGFTQANLGNASGLEGW